MQFGGADYAGRHCKRCRLERSRRQIRRGRRAPLAAPYGCSIVEVLKQETSAEDGGCRDLLFFTERTLTPVSSPL